MAGETLIIRAASAIRGIAFSSFGGASRAFNHYRNHGMAPVVPC